MPSRSQPVQHIFDGGWASDFGPNFNGSPRQDGLFAIPFLIDAENVVYEFNGAPRKAPGATKLNSSQLESGATITGIFDYWITGATGSPAQHRIINIGTKIKKDDGDGTFSDIGTGLQSGSIPTYAVLNDLLVIGMTGADVPRSWDGTTFQNLAGTPPNFSLVTEHKNRLWAAGVDANASRLYYSALLDPEDWVGAGSGTIDISPDDGDRITAITSHKNELWVFKGPYKGSIHRITGSAPTGSDPFERTTFVVGLGSAGHNSHFHFKDDLGFIWSDGSVHSLAATAAFGDFNDVAFSRPIASWIKSNVVFDRLDRAWAANCGDCGYVLFSLTTGGASANNMTLMMDYRFDPPRWSQWPAFISGSLAEVVDSASNDDRIIMAGGADGFVRKYQQTSRSIDGTDAIPLLVTVPFLSYGNTLFKKTLLTASVDLRVLNQGDFEFRWKSESSLQQSKTISGSTADAVLGPAATNQFILGTSVLGGGAIQTSFIELEEGGEFRAVQYQLSQSGVGEDVEIHSFGVEIDGGARSTENR